MPSPPSSAASRIHWTNDTSPDTNPSNWNLGKTLIRGGMGAESNSIMELPQTIRKFELQKMRSLSQNTPSL
jgi:hypothetical protein